MSLNSCQEREENKRLEAGDWRLETGGWRLEAEDCNMKLEFKSKRFLLYSDF